MTQPNTDGDASSIPWPPQEDNTEQTGVKAVRELETHQESRRTESLRNHWYFWVSVGLGLLCLLVALTVTTIAWHYLVAENWHWLTQSQLHSLRTLLFSGAITGALGFGSSYIRNRIKS